MDAPSEAGARLSAAVGSGYLYRRHRSNTDLPPKKKR
jgi:hypothetical protein